MNKKFTIIVLVAVTALTAGCEQTRRTLIKEKAAPDEFEVYTRAPLVLPPDYGLRPPSQSDTTTREADNTRQQARTVLVGDQKAPTTIQASTRGHAALYQLAGVDRAEPDIRKAINQETTRYSEEDKTVMQNILFSDGDYGVVVDPAAEAKRVRENIAAGRPVNQGEVPTIDQRKKRLLDNLFE